MREQLDLKCVRVDLRIKQSSTSAAEDTAKGEGEPCSKAEGASPGSQPSCKGPKGKASQTSLEARVRALEVAVATMPAVQTPDSRVNRCPPQR